MGTNQNAVVLLPKILTSFIHFSIPFADLIKEGLLPKGPRVIQDDDEQDSLQNFIVEEKVSFL